MNNLSLILAALFVMPAIAAAQALPDDPAPASPQGQPTSTRNSADLSGPPDALWMRIQQIANGQRVLVTNTYGPPLRCRFAGATDAFLFCDPPGTPAGTGYRFDRSTVLNVQVVREPHNWHPGYLSAIIAGGILTGICASQQASDGDSTKIGLIGAVVTGAIFSPMAFLPSRPIDNAFSAGIAFRSRAFGRTPRLFPFAHH